MVMAALVFSLLAALLTWWMLRRQLAPMSKAAVTLARYTNANEPRRPCRWKVATKSAN